MTPLSVHVSTFCLLYAQLADAAGGAGSDDETSGGAEQGTLRPTGWSTYQASWLESDDKTSDTEDADAMALDAEFNSTNLATHAATLTSAAATSGVIDREEGEKWHASARDDLTATGRRSQQQHSQQQSVMGSENGSDADDADLLANLDLLDLEDSARRQKAKDQQALLDDEKDFPDEVRTLNIITYLLKQRRHGD